MDGAEEFHYTMTMNKQGKTVLHLVDVKYVNHHTVFDIKWWPDTKIDLKRYRVNYDGESYHIGFAKYGTGYANADKGEDFENNYIKKQGDPVAFQFNYVDDKHSQAGSDAALVVNAQNFAAETAIPATGATSKGAPKKSPNFIEPTNPPQEPPTNLPEGNSIRRMPPAPGYENGYWIQTNEGNQPINIATGKPPSNVSKAEARAQTHVPLPAKKKK